MARPVTRTGALLAAAALEEALEVFAFDAPAGLATDQRAFELAGLEPATDGFAIQVQLGCYLIKGQESFGGHSRHDLTSVAVPSVESRIRIDKSMEG